jgi:hypothetical protein
MGECLQYQKHHHPTMQWPITLPVTTNGTTKEERICLHYILDKSKGCHRRPDRRTGGHFDCKRLHINIDDDTRWTAATLAPLTKALKHEGMRHALVPTQAYKNVSNWDTVTIQE